MYFVLYLYSLPKLINGLVGLTVCKIRFKAIPSFFLLLFFIIVVHELLNIFFLFFFYFKSRWLKSNRCPIFFLK